MSLLLLFSPRIGFHLPVLLDGRAEYIEGDASQPTVLVTVFFYDPDEDVYRPQFVQQATASLIHSGQHTLQTVEFDKRFGNSDGAFYLQFSHPPVTNQLSVRIVADLRGFDSTGQVQAAHLDRTIPVQQESEHPIPLASQSDTGADANHELRSSKRKDEELL